MESENAVEIYLERIWKNWQFDSGPCKGCPNRDKNGHHKPYYGDGSFDAEVAFVAETPGNSRDSQHSNEINWRLERDFIDSRTSGGDPSWIKGGNHLPESFFETIESEFVRATEGRTIYFTNTKKCPSIEPKTENWKDQKAKSHCKEYLGPEMEAVDPTVIVSFGRSATEVLYDIQGIDRSVGSLKHEVLNVKEEGDRLQIPSYHWSNLGRNHSNVDGVSSSTEYWDRLAEEINSALDRKPRDLV